MSLLALEDLTAGYRQVAAVRKVSLSVDAGEVVALLGRNGAGKTTILKATLGLARVLSGRVILAGREVTRWATYRRARSGTGYVPDDRRIFPDLTVRENLEVARKQGVDRTGGWDVHRIYRLMPWMQEMESRRGGLLSGGEQQMLAIARALMGNPGVLLLDEPMEGLAPQFVRVVQDLVRGLRSDGVAVLMAEPNLRFVLQLADRAYVLDSGELRLEGTMADVASALELPALLAM